MDRVLQRRDTASNWAKFNPVLSEGEIGIVIDEGKGYKIGDGVTHWNDLEYPSNPTSVVGTIGDSEVAVISQKGVSSLVGLDTYPVFSDTKSYVKGDIVNYGGLLYEFTADHEAGAWIGTDARETSLRGEVNKNLWNKAQGMFYSTLPIGNELVKEALVIYPDPIYLGLALNYKATDGLYHNRLYVYSQVDDHFVKSLFDFKYSTLEECQEGLKEEFYHEGYLNNYIVCINKNYKKTLKEDIICYLYPLIDCTLQNCPIIQKFLESNIFLFSSALANTFIKEIVAPDVDYNNIERVRLNIGYKLNDRYYNALYLDLIDGKVAVVFDNNYATMEECIIKSSGVIASSNGRRMALIDYGIMEPLILNEYIKPNHPLSTEYAPIITNYINSKYNKAKIELLEDNFDLTRNLIIKTSNQVIKDKYFNGSGYTDSVGYSVSNVIAIKGGVSYKQTFDKSWMGSNNYNAIVDELGNNPIKFEVTKVDNDTAAIFTLPTDCYVRINCGKKLDVAMLTEEEYFPSHYIQGGKMLEKYFIFNDAQLDIIKKEVKEGGSGNPLNGKIVVWDGDSISAGAKGIPWASRIMADNNMIGKNYSVGGGTITVGTTTSEGKDRHWVSSNIDAIYQEYPTLDYLVLEGGTNDADLRSQFEMGAFDPNDFEGPFDNKTFYGALDYLFFKAINYYPNSKICFIIAMKMGIARYDTFKIRKDFFDKIMQSCKKWGIPYLDLWNTNPMNPNIKVYWNPDLTSDENIDKGYYYADGQHPTNVGYAYLNSTVENWMKSI